MLSNLGEDTLDSIFDFLTCQELAQMMVLSKKFLITNKDLLYRKWSTLLSNRWGIAIEKIKAMNIPLGMGMKLLYECGMPVSYRILHSNLTAMNVTSEKSSFILNSSNMSISYIGAVGFGNRSVQGNTPFFSFKKQVNEKGMLEECASIFKKLRETISACSKGQKYLNIQKNMELFHTSPFMVKSKSNESDSCEFFYYPKCVSYYEVKIEPLTQNQNEMHDATISQFECIAVGLATRFFPKGRRLPGWDNESYGYHSDDGAIFHGRGRKLASYGPVFGYGDTVGCGINHKDSSVFFTLNGQYLGTAFVDVRTDKGLTLYPTVGIDAHATISFNFGQNEPFQFNLVRFIENNIALDSIEFRLL